MGWQDASLASPTGPKPAWESAPLATQSNAPAGGAVPEDPRDNGDYFTGGGFLSKVGNFLHRADAMSERGAHSLVAGVNRVGQAAADAVGLDSVGHYLGNDAAMNEAAAGAPVPGETTWQDVKANPSLSNVGSFVGEQAAGATPSLAAAAVALPVFAASRLGDVAHERAVNDQHLNLTDLITGQDHRQQTDVAPTIMDLLKAAPSAAVDTILMRGGLSGVLSGSLPKAIVREGIAQAGIPVADYAGETVGTNKGFDPAEAVDRGAAGLVAGIPLGAGAHLGVRAVRALRETYATKGVDTSGMSDEALTEGSLNGSIHPDVGPDQVNAILQSVGSDAAHFSTPERAATAAGRAKAKLPDVAAPLERELAAVEDTESHGDPNAVSPKGARGSMQTMPGTLRDPGFGVKPAANDSPEEMRRVGRDYYSALRDHYGSAAKAFAAYNAGPGALDGAMHKYGDEWLAHMPEETRNYVRQNIDKIGGEEPVYRAPPPTDEALGSDSGFERTDAPEEPLSREGVGESRTATGDSSSPFRESTDDPEGQPGFWEKRAQMHAEDLRKEWEASRQQPPPASEDPAAKYGANNYGQRPHMPEGSSAFAMTSEGHIADVNGKPVAFRNVKDAARFAAKNRLGGDFEPRVWATNSKRVVLAKRDGSSYGDRTARPEGPAEPAAGRSADGAQRLFPEWQKAPVDDGNGPPARAEGPAAVGQPATPESAPRAEKGPLRADRGYMADPAVSRETENVPAGPERFDEAPPAQEGDLYHGGTFERPRPEPVTDAEPRKPHNFLQMVVDDLSRRSRRSGLRHRLDAQDAINHGVEADSIYISPKAKYPLVKAHLHRIFSTDKAPLRSKAQPVKLHSLDNLGDRFDPQDFGIFHGDRPSPAEIATLLNDSIHGHDDALSRADPNYERRNEWIARHHAAEEFASRYGDRWHDMPDEELARIDADEGHDARIDEMLNHVLGHEAPEIDDATARPFASEAPDAARDEEDPQHDDGRSGEPREEGGRGAAAEDALIPPRETDQREALQRKADEPLTPGAEQKSAGSDGGLFDTPDTTGDLYGAKNKLVTREDYERAGKTFRDKTQGQANAGIDPEAVGAAATQAAFHAEATARRVGEMLLEPDANPAEAIRAAKDLLKDPKKTAGALLKGLDRFGSDWTYSSDGALRTLARHYDAPTIAKLADMFQSRRGADDSTDRVYDEAIARKIGSFINDRLHGPLDPFVGNKPAMERIRDLLAEPDRSVRATAKEREVAGQVRDLLKDVIDYRKEAGEDIGEVKNYFPRVLDALAVAKEPSKFRTAAEKLYTAAGVDDPVSAAEAWMTRVLDTHAGLDGGEEFLQSGGKPSSSKSREFGAKADTLLRDFYQKDPLLVLHDYIMGSIRRAEQTRRFGNKGAFDSKERAGWIKEHGTKTQWDVMLDQLRGELRDSGKDANGVVNQVANIKDTNLGRLSGKDVKRSAAVAKMHAWNQLAHLERVTLSSLGDAPMGFVRFGPKIGVAHLAGTFKEAALLIKTLGKRDPSDARRWAEAFGVVGHSNASALIQARMDMTPDMVRHTGLLSKFYHKIGIEQWTQGGRTMAAQDAKVFLGTLSDDLLSGSARTRQRATFYLKEAGVKDPQGFGQWLRNGGATPEALAGDRGHAADYATAVIRMANDTVLMPSRAHKPSWANHPLGSLIFALQSYNAAFTQNVLKRVGRLSVESVKRRDPMLVAPALAGLAVYTATQALQDYLRTAIFGGKPDKPDSDLAYALRIADRASFTGTMSPIFNAFGGLRYHRSTGQALQGSIIGSGVQAADAVGGLFLQNSKNTNTAERKVAGLVYDLGVNPAENAFGAKYLKGAAGTIAILGTGNKKGGLLPADRDAFIDAVAGKGK